METRKNLIFRKRRREVELLLRRVLVRRNARRMEQAYDRRALDVNRPFSRTTSTIISQNSLRLLLLSPDRPLPPLLLFLLLLPSTNQQPDSFSMVDHTFLRSLLDKCGEANLDTDSEDSPCLWRPVEDRASLSAPSVRMLRLSVKQVL